MADRIREIEESGESLGNIVAELASAKDSAMDADRNKMSDAIRRAEREWKSFMSACRVICEIREMERQDDEENSQC